MQIMEIKAGEEKTDLEKKTTPDVEFQKLAFWDRCHLLLSLLKKEINEFILEFSFTLHFW